MRYKKKNEAAITTMSFKRPTEVSWDRYVNLFTMLMLLMQVKCIAKNVCNHLHQELLKNSCIQFGSKHYSEIDLFSKFDLSSLVFQIFY